MKNAIEAILNEMERRQTQILPAGSERFFPLYEGYSLVNLPASIFRWLGAEPLPAMCPPLAMPDLQQWNECFDTVILILVDGIGLDWMQNTLERASRDDDLRFWTQLPADSLAVPLTSVVPSTTATALVSLWTGALPAAHGVVGYELFLKEYGILTNMITLQPAVYTEGSATLRLAGFNPETFLPVPTISRALNEQGVGVQVLLHRSIARSSLSQMLYPGAEIFPVGSLGDLFVTLEQLVARHTPYPRYIHAYWGAVDEAMHRFSPADPRAWREWLMFTQQFDLFFRQIHRQSRGKTLLLFAADHGHISTPRRAEFEVRRHPRLMDCLTMVPSGEARLPFAFVRAGKEAAFQEAVTSIWNGRFEVLPAAEFVRAGWLGNTEPTPCLWDRIGDFVILPHEGDYWYFGLKENSLLGRHGGLSRTEMLILLLGVAF
ncbi:MULTISPECIES: alkaline phosphatase family protein [Anaerolinea]|uniref:alkaline phosphatase family protein n=1 Tax=Anaerolinea TaxID=233189 RepID=UPI00261F2BE4|nr:alkaline phosphatase family protein [Anaerolinea thermophila]